ncbi:ribonuclease HII [Desulfovibrio inopinatus]|uniref:ribonuclease HII n=1 Tax=Desulfovibrio inopinatus TaxID=102109 RepID=UPI001FE0D5FC|nr:ribonuclease HII [Desulfovibrio inopinatus]
MTRTAGVDEAGRGCLAGPVVAAAVILPESFVLPGLNDSKQVKEELRYELSVSIKQQARAYSIGVAWPGEIDRVNILQATFLAMSRAVMHLRIEPVHLFIDGNKTIPPHALPELSHRVMQRAIIGGDATVACISAASIIAKTFRDTLMKSLAKRYPGYGFERHKGYGTKAHLQAILQQGPSAMHRMTFRGVTEKKQKTGTSAAWLPGISQ